MKEQRNPVTTASQGRTATVLQKTDKITSRSAEKNTQGIE